MHVLRSEFFVRKDFAFYDCCIIAVLPPRLFQTYDLLRRHAWEGKIPINFLPEAGLRDRGFVFSVLSRKTIGAMLGIDTKTVGEHLGVLKKLEWIKSEPKKPSGVLMYKLGHYTDGGSICWWADSWFNYLYAWMIRTTELHPTPKPRFRDTGDAGTDMMIEEDRASYEGRQPYYDMDLARIPIATRVKLVKAFVDTCLKDGTEVAIGLRISIGEDDAFIY
jgi:hypothetical protein